MTLLDYLEIGGILGLFVGLWGMYGWGVALTAVSAIILAVALTSRFRAIDRQGINNQDTS